jgi:uncharacterized protein
MRIREPFTFLRLACFIAILGFVFPAFAALDIDSLKPEGYVSDFAHVVDAANKQEIEQYCYRVEQSLGVQLALVTIDTLDDRDIETVANRLFRHFGVGSQKGNQGVLLLLAIKDHKSRIEVGYGIEPYLTDGFSGSILRSIRPDLQGSNYGAALLNASHQMANQIAQGKNLTPPPYDTPEPRRERRGRPESGGLPVPLIILGLFVLFWLFSRGSGRGGRGGGGGGFLPGMILGSMLNSGRSRDWGGGGFGGWDSGGGGGGGGFGGFGGGSSGGGGASSDW